MRHLSVWTKVSLWCWFAIALIAIIADDILIEVGHDASIEGNAYATGELLGVILACMFWAVILTTPLLLIRWLIRVWRRRPRTTPPSVPGTIRAESV